VTFASAIACHSSLPAGDTGLGNDSIGGGAGRDRLSASTVTTPSMAVVATIGLAASPGRDRLHAKSGQDQVLCWTGDAARADRSDTVNREL
jgi:hypothetical protein